MIDARTPRQLRDARLPAGLDTDPPPAWYAVLGYLCLGVMLSWLFLVVVLGWGPK